MIVAFERAVADLPFAILVTDQSTVNFAFHRHILDIAQQAMRDCDIEPELKPIRGGTDGAQLSFMGLPCPNLFTGGYNYHGKHEFVTLEGMEKAVQVIVRIAELTAQRK
jgi:tripeptide aminopeptidase